MCITVSVLVSNMCVNCQVPFEIMPEAGAACEQKKRTSKPYNSNL